MDFNDRCPRLNIFGNLYLDKFKFTGSSHSFDFAIVDGAVPCHAIDILVIYVPIGLMI